MPARPRPVPPPVPRTVPVLAVLVCHDGETWLRQALSAVRHSSPRPRHVIAVDTGSTDGTAEVLAAAASRAEAGPGPLLSGVLTLPRDASFSEAVHHAVRHATDRWGDPGSWLWVLHDDCAPAPDCLATLLTAAESAPSAGVLGPLAVDWTDSRLIVEAGLSTDASGHRQTGVGPSEPDWSALDRRTGGLPGGRYEQSSEVLAVSSAGMLVRRELWDRLGGFDPHTPVLREDVDLGWRANLAGSVVLCVPAARVRHARALTTGARPLDVALPAVGSAPVDLRTAERALGLRTFLVNCGTSSFLLGLPRLAVLGLLRALAFALPRRLDDAAAELRALRYLFGGRAGLRAARVARPAHGNLRGLFTSRLTRLRNGVRAGLTQLVRSRVEADAALGRLPTGAGTWPPPGTDPVASEPGGADGEPAGSTPGDPAGGEPAEPAGRLPVGPQALPAGAGTRPKRTAGLRRPAAAIAVTLIVPQADRPVGLRPSPRPRPSPGPRGDGPHPAQADEARAPELMLVPLGRARIAREILLAPPLPLVLALTAIGLVVNAGRFGTDLAGGRLLAVDGLAETWSQYLAAWHGVAGGTGAPAPAARGVGAVLGMLLAPVGGAKAAVALLLLAELPLAGLAAYVASRRAGVRRWARALVALGYALLPAASAAVAQGRLDVVVVHILLPPVVAGVAALLAGFADGSPRWLSTAAGTAVALAVLGAFSPLVHLLLVAFALIGFVVVPGRHGDGRRRVTALFLLVLMPLALLLPWPAVVIQHPGVVSRGVGAAFAEPVASLAGLVALHPGGPGGWPVVGLVVPIAALLALLLRPHRAALPGLGLALLGAAAVVAVRTVEPFALTGGADVAGHAGAGLVVVGCGLLWTVLAASRPNTGGLLPALRDRGRAMAAARAAAALGAAGLALLATGVLVAGRAGPLRTGGGFALAGTLTAELADSGLSVLVLAHDGVPTRQTAGRVARFGDDDLAPVPAATGRLAALDAGLRSTDPATARAAVATAATSGVLFLVLPDADAARRLRVAAGDLIADAPAASDGRPVLRMLVGSGAATLLSPEVATLARSDGRRPSTLDTTGIVRVAAAPPEVAVRVSDGPDGRLLVLAAADEPGWRATVDGRQVPTVRAWGQLVGVELPGRAAEVRVEYASASRGGLLLAQGAVALFALLTAIPSRRPERDR